MKQVPESTDQLGISQTFESGAWLKRIVRSKYGMGLVALAVTAGGVSAYSTVIDEPDQREAIGHVACPPAGCTADIPDVDIAKEVKAADDPCVVFSQQLPHADTPEMCDDTEPRFTFDEYGQVVVASAAVLTLGAALVGGALLPLYFRLKRG